MIQASCHCGQVEIEVPEAPTSLTSCNCSICRKLGWILAYYPSDQVRLLKGENHVVGYVHGDRTLSSYHCPTCGCGTHWRGLGEHAHRTGVNARLMDPAVLRGVMVRFLDGADTWDVLGEKPFGNRHCCI